jgi:hypothetical protein
MFKAQSKCLRFKVQGSMFYVQAWRLSSLRPPPHLPLRGGENYWGLSGRDVSRPYHDILHNSRTPLLLILRGILGGSEDSTKPSYQRVINLPLGIFSVCSISLMPPEISSKTKAISNDSDEILSISFRLS